MSFKLSLASLIDQHDSGIGVPFGLPGMLALSHSHSFNTTLPTKPDLVIPQIFLINPSGDNIFRHIDTQSAHAAIIGLIYFSMWMGALGWDIVSTMFFDIRVIRETTWSSLFSAVYSIAYLLSRYVSLAWLITAVTNSVIMTNSCDAWMKGSTSLFSIGISATMCVFCLRTCSIWHMKPKVVWLVVGSWLLVTAFAVLLPIMSDGTRLSTSSFCAWHFNGLYVVGVFGALLLFDLLCLVLTVLKLNKAGWRGILRGIFPSSRHNMDSEDVKTMLVQKTTAFFVIQFIFLISALLVYVATSDYAYKMMNIVASVAVASSMAGRIFRKAWRQTREMAPGNINKPPSYYPGWEEEHRSRQDALSVSKLGTGGNASAAHKRATRKQIDSLDFYVEGEFGPKALSSAVSLRSVCAPCTAAQIYAAQQMPHLDALESGQLGESPGHTQINSSIETFQIRRESVTELSLVQCDGGRDHQDASMAKAQHAAAAARDGLSPAPAYSRLIRDVGDPRQATNGAPIRYDSFHGSDGSRTGSAGGRSRRGMPEGYGSRLGTVESQAASTNGSFLTFSSIGGSQAETADTDPSFGRQPGNDVLVGWPRRRSEPSVTPVDEDDTASIDSAPVEPEMEERRKQYIASPPMLGGARLSSKEESKKVYDFESVKAAAKLDSMPPPLARQVTTRPSTTSSIDPHYRIGGMAEGSAGSLASMSRADIASGSTESLVGRQSAETSSSRGQLTPRPRTAPAWPSPHLSPSDSSVSQLTLVPSPQVDGAVGRERTLSSSSSEDAESDALFAFRQTIEEDSREWNGSPRSCRGRSRSGASERCSSKSREERIGTSDSSGDLRPRTSRGTGLGSFGKPRTADDEERRKLTKSARLRTAESTTSSGGTRPSTAAGEDVKPFGFGILYNSASSLPRIGNEPEAEEAEKPMGSAIERQYAKLAAAAEMSLDPPRST